MPDHTSREGQRVDRIRVREDHDNWRGIHPTTGEDAPDPGIPILTSSRIGNILEKSIMAYTVKCPDCRIPARYDEDGTPICEECGIICTGQSHIREERILNDAKAAGRVPGDERATPTS